MTRFLHSLYSKALNLEFDLTSMLPSSSDRDSGGRLSSSSRAASAPEPPPRENSRSRAFVWLRAWDSVVGLHQSQAAEAALRLEPMAGSLREPAATCSIAKLRRYAWIAWKQLSLH